ncbi:MAG: RluA family pseudouridine synthase [Firmicutes bacterium]|nr:RluA family pseudouridine synthase [Bacillota bacterium]
MDNNTSKTFSNIASGVRLDVFLNEQLTDFSRSRLKQLVESGSIFVNGKAATKAGQTLKQGDEITITMPPDQASTLVPINIPLDIVYEDKYIAVINKPQGLTVHPSPTSSEPTLINALLFHLKSLSSVGGVMRPGIVHRLDKNTSGLMVVAKTDTAHNSLSEQLANREIKRQYIALVKGNPKFDTKTVDTYITRDKKDRTKFKATSLPKDAKHAITHITVLDRFDAGSRNHPSHYALLQANLQTGRTHQIRVHLSYLNLHIVGDKEYGVKLSKTREAFYSAYNIKGQLLHSAFIEFAHPITNKLLSFTAPLPDYFQDFLTHISHPKN